VSRRITVLVGTDHHGFSRLVQWADLWQAANPDDEVLVQHGFSAGPTRATGVELVPPSELLTLLAMSDVVVTHGGPGTIMSARHAGHHPLAVPRNPALDEHVDQHQMHFVSWAAAKGLCTEAISVDELTGTVAALGDAGTRTDTQVVLTPEVDDQLLERTIGSGRRRRAASLSAVPVLYFPGSSWHPTALPPGTDPSRLLVLGNVSQLWLGGPELACSCGLPHHECPLWGAVTQRAFDGPVSAEELRSLHAEVRNHPAAAGRRHPGPERRRRYLRLSLAYRRACAAALQVAGAEVVVDHGGPLADVLALSHCRELDVRVLRGATPDRTDKLVQGALRWRGVPTWRPDDAAQAGSPAAPMTGHQLHPTGDSASQRSITW